MKQGTRFLVLTLGLLLVASMARLEAQSAPPPTASWGQFWGSLPPETVVTIQVAGYPARATTIGALQAAVDLSIAQAVQAAVAQKEGEKAGLVIERDYWKDEAAAAKRREGSAWLVSGVSWGVSLFLGGTILAIELK